MRKISNLTPLNLPILLSKHFGEVFKQIPINRPRSFLIKLKIAVNRTPYGIPARPTDISLSISTLTLNCVPVSSV